MVAEYIEALKEQKLSRCPLYRRGNCSETERPSGRIKPCLIEHGQYDCEEWNKIQEEWIKEAAESNEANKPNPSYRIIK